MKTISTLLFVFTLFTCGRFAQAQNNSSILFVVHDATAYNNADQLIAEELNSMGLDVHKASASEAADTTGVDLIIISSTVMASNISGIFAAAAIPIMTWEGGMYDDLLMCPGPAWGISMMNNDSALIVNPAHPLAAGFQNKVRIVTQVPQEYTIIKKDSLTDSAIPIATITDDIGDEQTIIIGFEKGAVLVDGSRAAARRVGFFMRDNTATVLTEEGWALFRAAVAWALDDNETGVSEKSQIPQNIQLLPNYPNPFNPKTTIPFVVASSSQIAIDIFDVQGRLVASLLHGTAPAGRHSVEWNGADLHGHPSPSGLYFVRMKSGGFTQMQKILLAR